MSRRVNLVAAVSRVRGIGIDGRLPWRLRGDMRFFHELTSRTEDAKKQNAVIMGRLTWLSIPEKYRPLRDRVNIVLSQTVTDIPGALVSRSLNEALELVDSDELSPTIESIFVIGGSSVYYAAMETARDCRIYYTDVQVYDKCDVFFPVIDPNRFRRLKRGEFPDVVPKGPITEGEITYEFRIYDKIQ